ncbi:MAG: efflux RND transporter periplasmic adaptor subunit [Alistipes senegalensis]|nr:efflux RND transporter periplasmic adaptor subunit [Oxalobacter formigenes]MCM1281712.1 efflux RND transporter periplasmic adaptor subunit [Alistipes senegalensis]
MSSLPVLYRGSLFGVLFAAVCCLTGCREEAEPVQQNVKVNYLVAQANNVPLITEMPGRVSAFLVSEVRPQVSGIIQKRLFEEGSDVKEGQPLYQIDPALFKAAYDSARADLARAQANVVAARLMAERYGKIVDINAVSKQEYDDAVAARDQAIASVNVAKQAVETARINLEYTKVLSPVSGRISRSFVTPGALVTQNQPDPLATVQQLSPVYVDVTQSSTELLKLRRALATGEVQDGAQRGTRIKLKLEDGTPYAKIGGNRAEGEEPDWILGKLLFSDVTIEQSTGVVTVRATFDNPDHVLLPGMYVRAVIEEGVREGTVLVPQKTVMRDTKNRPMVYVLTKENPLLQNGEEQTEKEAITEDASLGQNDYYVATRYVTLDRDYRNNWLITDGLKPGDKVLTDGLQKVKHGQVVTGEAVRSEVVQEAVSIANTEMKETETAKKEQQVVKEEQPVANAEEKQPEPEEKTAKEEAE